MITRAAKEKSAGLPNKTTLNNLKTHHFTLTIHLKKNVK
jgi:hypothetical protein